MRIRWKNTGRLAGFLLSLALLLELGPSGVQAQSGAVCSIGSAEDLLAFAESVDQGESYAGRTVTLTADIDMAGRAFAPIGRPESGLSHVFQGVFNGGGHTISGLVLSDAGTDSAGLFAELHNAVVRDLSLDAVVAANGPGAVGALAGWMVNGTVRNVQVSAYVTAAGWDVPEDGSAAVGIVAGKATGRTVMDRVAAQGASAGAGADRWAVYVGGLIGYIQGGGSIANCYTTASVFCNDAGVYVGGFFGGAVNPPPVSNSYAAALVIGGRATSGAFAGYYDGERSGVFNVWYDRDLAGALAGVAAPGESPLNGALLSETTSVMQGGGFPSRLGSAFTQAGPGQNQGYPVFSHEAPPPEPSATPTPSPEPSATPEPSPEPSASPEPFPEPSATPEPSPEPTATPEPSPEPSATPEPSPELSATPEPSPVPSASPAPSPEPSATPEPSPEPSATPTPSMEPSIAPETEAPTFTPIAPSPEPEAPTASPINTIFESTSPTDTPAAPVDSPPVSQRPPIPQPVPPSGPPDTPRTGDGADAMFWLSALVLCSIGLAYAVIKRRGPF